MLLRRVIEHVREQNWTAISIDFVIVVIGVFVGLQVQEWSQGRADRQSERQIVQDLLAGERLRDLLQGDLRRRQAARGRHRQKRILVRKKSDRQIATDAIASTKSLAITKGTKVGIQCVKDGAVANITQLRGRLVFY